MAENPGKDAQEVLLRRLIYKKKKKKKSLICCLISSSKYYYNFCGCELSWLFQYRTENDTPHLKKSKLSIRISSCFGRLIKRSSATRTYRFMVSSSSSFHVSKKTRLDFL